MADHQSQFVVNQLRPEGLGGNGAGGVYQLTASSVNPTRIIGVDEIGMPIEDTVPAAYHKLFVMPDGGINKVPMRTAAVFSMDPAAERYEQQTTRDIIKAGAMPLNACPYTFEYSHITGGPLAKVPAGEKDCGGSTGPRGCVHMQKVIEARLARSQTRFEADQKRVETMKTEDIQRMTEAMTVGIGAAIAEHMGGAKPAGKPAPQRQMRPEE